MTKFRYKIESLECDDKSFFKVNLSMRKVNMCYFNEFLKEVGNELFIDIDTENLSTSPSATLEKPKETNSSFIQDCSECKFYPNECKNYVHRKLYICSEFEMQS